MKDFLGWLMPLAAFIILLLIILSMFTQPQISSQVPWDELPKDGWTFVGRTPEGHAIKKKYFPEHGVWIYSAYARNESISAVPLEILQRTQAGDKYK